MKVTTKRFEVVIDKLIHGGQGIGTLPNGKRVLAWNVLPGEKVVVETQRSKSKYFEGIAVEVLEPSAERIQPRDEAYLSTSPWQIMTFEAENNYKRTILAETFAREHVLFDHDIDFDVQSVEWGYRNKMEYSFWGDDDGLHLALFNRGSHGKRIINGSGIAMSIIDEIANKIVKILNKSAIRASQLKTVMIRASQSGDVVAALFVKDADFPEITELSGVCKGMVVHYSTPKSPASVITKELYRYGSIELSDVVRSTRVSYDVHSFFQVNVPVFERVVERIEAAVHGTNIVDFYSGVGTIGLSVGMPGVLVDSDRNNCEMALVNAKGTEVEVVMSPAEKATGYIDAEHSLIVDPPRAGLHEDVIDRIREAKSPLVAYLSCNPSTQARDVARLQDMYQLDSLRGYNFFPRTPHIESLAILSLRAEDSTS